MDVMRTAVSALGTALPERSDHGSSGARDIADRLMASLGSMLLYWYHWTHNGKRVDVETDDDSIGGHFLHVLHGKPPTVAWIRAMHTSLNLYAEHEFNASTFTARVIAGTGSDMYSAITGAIGALRGPKHGGANEVSFEIQMRYDTPAEAEADIRRRVEAKEVVIGFGHPVYTVSDPRNRVIKDVARKLSEDAHDLKMYTVAERHRGGHEGREEHVRQPGLVFRGQLPHDGRAHRHVHAAVRHLADRRMGGARHRTAQRRQDHPAQRQLRRPRGPVLRAACAKAIVRARMRVSFRTLWIGATAGMLACVPAHTKILMAQGSAGPSATARAIGDPVAEDAVSAATQASEHWLAVVDAGKFVESWKGAADVFRLGVTETEWVGDLQDIHSRLGKMTMRELKGAQFSTRIRGAPTTGEYVTVSYLTKFANAPIALETLIVSKEADGEWRIAGYNIDKAPDK